MFNWARKTLESFANGKQIGRAPKGALKFPLGQLVQGSYPGAGLTPSSLGIYLKDADAGMVEKQAELIQEMIEKDCHLGGLVQSGNQPSPSSIIKSCPLTTPRVGHYRQVLWKMPFIETSPSRVSWSLCWTGSFTATTSPN